MLAAFDCATQYVCRLAIPIEAKQAKHGTGAPPDDVQLFVGCNEIIDEQSRSRMCIRKQAVVAKTLRHRGKRINDLAQAGGAPDAERAGHSRRIAAFEFFSQVSNGPAGEFCRRLTTRNSRVRCKE